MPCFQANLGEISAFALRSHGCCFFGCEGRGLNHYFMGVIKKLFFFTKRALNALFSSKYIENNFRSRFALA